MNSPKNACLNCGKSGHMLKMCKEPITSYGIICFNINQHLNITNNSIESYLYNKYVDINEYNYTHLNNISLIPEYYDKIKILMVRRKHSLNYVEFIRGKYELNEIKNNKIFELMTIDEINRIKLYNFDLLWNELWNETATHKIYMKEYNLSKIKFEELKNNNFYNMLDDMTKFIYSDPEWGFPKGRRNTSEKNLNCAIREFVEETHINLNNINILERLNHINEDFIGTNSKIYRHTYYLANSEIELNVSSDDVQLNEISDIKWLNVPEAIEKIRPYCDAKIKMLHQIYFFIINLIQDISKCYIKNMVININ